MRPTTARTLKWLRQQGMLAGKVEQWVQIWRGTGSSAGARPPGVRRDLFGVADVVAVPDFRAPAARRLELSYPTVYVQSCAAGDHAAHAAKILAAPAARALVRAGNGILLISWSKRGPRGKRKLWTPRVEDVTGRLLPQGEGVVESPQARPSSESAAAQPSRVLA